MPDIAALAEACSERPLFGGALSATFPQRFQDISNIRDVPDHQEAFADPDRDESIIIELLDLKNDVGDHQSALWFFQDLAHEEDASQNLVVENVSTLSPSDVPFLDPSTVVTAAIGQMALSKGRQGREASNIVKVYIANIRLKGVGTDVLVTAYEPLVIRLHQCFLRGGGGRIMHLRWVSGNLKRNYLCFTQACRCKEFVGHAANYHEGNLCAYPPFGLKVV